MGKGWIPGMDSKLYVGILEDELQESLKYYKKKPGSNEIMTPNAKARWL